jgi:hypothetical protein
MRFRGEAFAEVSGFRDELYACLTVRGDELFELADAVLCAPGAVYWVVELTLLPEHRRGHGAMYDGLNQGRINNGRLRSLLAGLPLPRFPDGRLVLAVDVSAGPDRSRGARNLSPAAPSPLRPSRRPRTDPRTPGPTAPGSRT